MVFTVDPVTCLQQLLSPIILAERAALLDQNVFAEEIINTMFSMPSNKAPGLDGYTAEFFKSS